MTDFLYPLFPLCAFLGCALSLVPLCWHLQAWNSGTCYYMLWTALACLNQFVNAVAWHDTTVNFAPVWCDISSRIMVASSVAIPLCSLCINRRLYNIARVQGVSLTRDDKRRTVLIDTLLCVGLPLLQVVAYYIVEGHRFDIFQDIGCYPTVVPTLATLLLIDIWPIVIGIVSGVYCVLALRALFHRQAQFNQFLSSNKAITKGRYLRLMALAATDVVLTVPLAALSLALNARAGLAPYGAWADVHFDFARVGQYPRVLWGADVWAVAPMELTRWAPVLCAAVFVAFFGFAEEARRHYAAALAVVLRPAAPALNWLSGWRISVHHASDSQAALAVSVTTSTCKFDVEKGAGSFDAQSLDGMDDVLPLYEGQRKYRTL